MVNTDGDGGPVDDVDMARYKKMMTNTNRKSNQTLNQIDFQGTQLREGGVTNATQGRPTSFQPYQRHNTPNLNVAPQSPLNNAMGHGDSVAGKHQPERSDSDLWDLLAAG